MVKDDGLSDEERELFQKAVQDVRPLSTSCHIHKIIKPTTQHRLRASSTKPTVEKQFIPLSSYIVEPVSAENILRFNHPGVSTKQLDMLKKGQFRIEAKLDLHGCTPDDAQDALCAFIHRQQHLHRRHVLIIHGKGGRFGESPVIKNLVNRWLTQLPQVLAFHSALVKHGGSGALYVLLKSIIKP